MLLINAIGDLFRWLGFLPVYIGFWALFSGVCFGIVYRTSEPARRARMAAIARNNPVFCRSCRWAVPDTRYSEPDGDLAWSGAHCMHMSARKNPAEFLVIGHDRPEDMLFCSIARDRVSLCGPRGRYWEKGQQVIAPAPPASLPADERRSPFS